MDKLVDLYSRILIGTFSFIGPSFTILISLFYPAFNRASRLHTAQLKMLLKLLSSSETQTSATSVTKSFHQLIRDNEKNTQLLTPVRQMKRLGLSLSLSIFFLAFYHFQHTPFFRGGVPCLRQLTLFLSGISFGFALFVLWQIFCIIIYCKKEEEALKMVKETGHVSSDYKIKIND